MCLERWKQVTLESLLLLCMIHSIQPANIAAMYVINHDLHSASY